MFEVSVTGVSEEDEVMLFLEASGLKFPSEVGVKPRLIAAEPRGKVQGSVCFRCGQVGHMMRNCPGQVPSLESLEAACERERKSVVSMIVAEEMLNEDEFGPTRADLPPRFAPSWKNTFFCDNCGKPAHVNERCWFPHFEQTRSFFAHMQEDHPREEALMRSRFRHFWSPTL